MRYVWRILEAITIIVWAACIMLALGGDNLRLIAALYMMNAGLWIIAIGITAYKSDK